MIEKVVAREPESRLVYSTEGDSPAPEKAARLKSAVPNPHGVRIRLERRASGRLVTLVTGLPPDADAADLARVLKSACGAGGTVKDGVLEIQGDQRSKVEATLRDRGIPSKRAGG